MVKKWLILINYIMMNSLNGYSYASLASIPERASSYYGVTLFEINLFAISFFILYLLAFPISSWGLSKNLHNSLLISWIFMTAGALTRCMAGKIFGLALFGQTLLASMTPLVLSSISTLSVLWFPIHQ